MEKSQLTAQGQVLAPHRFDSHKRIRELLAELEQLSLDITENDPRRKR